MKLPDLFVSFGKQSEKLSETSAKNLLGVTPHNSNKTISEVQIER